MYISINSKYIAVVKDVTYTQYITLFNQLTHQL